MPSMENIELMSDEVSEIMEVLSENNIITEKRNRRQQNQLNNRQNFSYESNPRYERQPITNREGNSFRNQQPSYNREELPKTQNKPQKINYDDDYALIQDVRLNTQSPNN
jgi:hypothetical protein